MSYTNFSVETDADGIATVTWDMPDKSMNVISESSMGDFEKIVDAMLKDNAVKGVVLTSGKATFGAGADLSMLEGFKSKFETRSAEAGKDVAVRELFENCRHLNTVMRTMETGGKPFVAALNGTALGGCFEIALACHARVLADDDKTVVGLPEVKVGLFPGGGGTQRVPRMADLQAAVMMLLQGQSLKPAKAKSMGLVNDVVPAGKVVAAAKKLILDGLEPVQPWDKKGFKPPSGAVHSPAGYQFWPPASAIYHKETYDNYPAARAILKVVHDGLQLPFDRALTVESRYFCNILQTREAEVMIRSLFMSMQQLNKGARRPVGEAPSTLKKVGIVGAGFMGSDVAYVTASAGLKVVLLDRDKDSAERGKAHSATMAEKLMKRGKMTESGRDKLLSLITPTDSYDDLDGCDLVIEAVFEDRDLKADVTAKAEATMKRTGVFASNTSTIPISLLAQASKRPKNFVGIHFFSPVHKMMLVEIIMGKRTSDKAVAMALDYVKAIKKTPIVVNDSRGFYTSRVVGTYVQEGHRMLAEGVPAAMIENVARMAGMPIGPLALNDEVAIDLSWKIMQATKKDLGAKFKHEEYHDIVEKMVVKLGRNGRKNGKGFYDYPEKGQKALWPGVGDLVETKLDPDSLDVEELKQRFLVAQALETSRIFEEGVLTDVREADVGSILGFGFAPYSGGTLSYIDGIGTDAFVALCKLFQKKYGPRFKPNKLLLDLAEKGESFYGRFAAKSEDQAAA